MARIGDHVNRSLGRRFKMQRGAPAAKTYQDGPLLAYSVVCWISLATSPVQPV